MKKSLKRKPYDWRTSEFNDVVKTVKYRGYDAHVSVPYAAPNAETLADRFAGKVRGFIYPGMGEGNPTVREFERAMTATETDKVDEYDSYACASGSSAIQLLATYFLRKQKLSDGKYEMHAWDAVVSAYIYGGTYLFLSRLPEFGMSASFVQHPENPESWHELTTLSTKFFLLETPSNPHGTSYDISMVADIAHRWGLPLVVDNTIATGALQRPLDLGADIVLLSATKGVNGHSTSAGGVIVGKKEFIKEFRAWTQCMRPVMDPHVAVDMMIGLSDLDERMARHSANALKLATMLEAHPLISKVYYSFLPSNSGHDLAKRQMKGGGPLFSFTLDRWCSVGSISRYRIPGNKRCSATIEESRCFIDMLTENGLIPLAVHIAHDTTLATHPASTSHAKVPKEMRERNGISDNMIRISVGSESPRAFQKVMKQFEKTLDAWSKKLM